MFYMSKCHLRCCTALGYNLSVLSTQISDNLHVNDIYHKVVCKAVNAEDLPCTVELMLTFHFHW